MRTVRRALPAVTLALVLAVWGLVLQLRPPEALPQDPLLVEATVTKVWDGDTIHVEHQGTDMKVRLIGIDCPEIGANEEAWGDRAAAMTRSLCEGSTVWLESDVGDTDKYNRPLRYVWLKKPKEFSEAEAADKMLNARLLREGLAEIMTIPPNTGWADAFEIFESEARDQALGIWEK